MCAINIRDCSILDTCSEYKPQSELSEWYVSYGFSCRGPAKYWCYYIETFEGRNFVFGDTMRRSLLKDVRGYWD